MSAWSGIRIWPSTGVAGRSSEGLSRSGVRSGSLNNAQLSRSGRAGNTSALSGGGEGQAASGRVVGPGPGNGCIMRALTTLPLTANSLEVSDVPDPAPAAGDLLVDGLAVGVCGTDKEIARGDYGWAPPGRERLVLGHESLGRVREAPDGSDFSAGDLVVGVVRRPDPEPCGACGHGEFDMCRNGKYTERGIKEIDGYASEQWTVETDFAVKLDPRLEEVGMLMEPTTVVAKAWEQVERIGARAWFEPKSVLVTGAGPIGLLAALLGVQRGLDVHVLDIVTGGPKPQLVQDLGATFHHSAIHEVTDRVHPDIVIEATGVGPLVFGAMAGTASYGIVCLTGVSSGGRTLPVDAGELNRDIVLENDAVVGSVNANLRHYAQAADSLARADLEWLDRLVTRRVPLASYADAFEARDDDVKVAITLG
jgi:glucose 1-dehydrogenase